MNAWPLEKFGLNWLHPRIPLAHPIPSGPTGVLYRSVDETADTMNSPRYARVMRPFVSQWAELFS